MALIPRKRMSSDLLDPKPKEGSFNGVTSDGVFKATGEAIDNILDNGSASETIVVAVPSSQSSSYTVGNYYEVQGKVARLRTKTDGDNVTQLTFDTTSGLLDAMNDIVEDITSIGSPLQWKGPATVAQLNAGITGIQPGWTYTLTDAGTITDGSVTVDAGDEVAWTEDGEWFKLGGDSSKITVFEAGERFTNFPTFAQIKAEIAKGKTVVIKTSDDEMWYLIRSNSAYCWFQGASEWFIIRVDDSDNWTTPYQYDSSLNSQSYNAVQNRVLYEKLNDIDKIAVFDGIDTPSETKYPDEAEVRAAVDAGKYVVIRISGTGGHYYYGIGYQYANQYMFPNLLISGNELRLQLNQQGTGYEWSYYQEPVIPGAKVFTGTYNPAASPADYSGMPNTLSIAAALDAGNDVVLMLTNPADYNSVTAYRIVSNEQYTKRFIAIDNAAMSTGWNSVPGLIMTYAGPGNPWGWSMARFLSQELRAATITEADLSSGHCGVNNLNALTTMTLTSVNSVTMHTNDYTAVNNFAVQIDNTGNSNDVTIDVRHGPDSLKYSVAGGNVVGAGKYVQLTCVGNCWTLAEFTAPTP